VKFIAILFFIVAAAVPSALAQQTQTNCNLYGNTANCTSTTTPTFQQQMDSFNKSMESLGNNIGAARQQTMNVKVRLEYCRQNPAGSVVTDTGLVRNCVDEIAYIKAACDVKKWKGLCGKDWVWIKTYTPPATAPPSGEQVSAGAGQGAPNGQASRQDCDSYEDMSAADKLSYPDLLARAQKLSSCSASGATDAATVASNATYSITAQAYESMALLRVIDYLKRHQEANGFVSEDAAGQR
jgi:hypothetical protein